MALSPTLNNILDGIAATSLQDVAGVAGVTGKENTALSRVSAATPLSVNVCGTGVARVTTMPVLHLLHHERGNSVAAQTIDNMGFSSVVTPATPATPEKIESPSFREQTVSQIALLLPLSPCAVCGQDERWDDAGIWRCRACWPMPLTEAARKAELRGGGGRGSQRWRCRAGRWQAEVDQLHDHGRQ